MCFRVLPGECVQVTIKCPWPDSHGFALRATCDVVTRRSMKDNLVQPVPSRSYHRQTVMRPITPDNANPSHSSGRGGAGNTGHGNGHSPVDLAQLSIEERDAFAKVRSRDPPVVRGGRG